MYCNNCGNALTTRDKFCPKCGQPVEKSSNTLLTGNQSVPTPAANYPAVKEADKKKKKKGCLIAAIITAVLLIVIAAVVLMVYTLTPLNTTSNIPSGLNTTPNNQELDIKGLTTPADLRGEGMAGYWTSAEIMDAQGDVINDLQVVALLHLDEDGNCQLRMMEGEESYDFYGTCNNQTGTIYDSYSDVTLKISMEMRNRDLYLGMGEDLENLTFVFEGPYNEETLVYQNLEYYKAGAFATSAMLENQDQSDLTYAQWEHGITTAYSYWMSLYKLSATLEFAVDINMNLGVGMGEQQSEKGSIANISYMQYDSDEIQGVIDRATSMTRIKKLAEHLQISAQEAAKVLFEVQNNITEEAYKDEAFYGKCETYARRISTGSKVTLLICGTVASGGTLSLAGGTVFFIQGADVAMEITENEAYISYEIEGKQSSKKALEGVENIRTWTAPAASIVGLKDLAGTRFEKFMVLKDTAFDAVDGKICSIRVVDSSSGTMLVSQVAPENFDEWKAANDARGYELTKENREEIWREIYAMAQEQEAQESESTEKIVAQNPTQSADILVTIEPILETTTPVPDIETPAVVSGNPFVGSWILTYTYYPSGLDNGAEIMDDELYEIVTYKFRDDLTVDICVVIDGTKQCQYTNKPYRLEAGIAYIDNMICDGDTGALDTTVCKVIDNKLYLHFANSDPTVWVLDPTD